MCISDQLRWSQSEQKPRASEWVSEQTGRQSCNLSEGGRDCSLTEERWYRWFETLGMNFLLFWIKYVRKMQLLSLPYSLILYVCIFKCFHEGLNTVVNVSVTVRGFIALGMTYLLSRTLSVPLTICHNQLRAQTQKDRGKRIKRQIQGAFWHPTGHLSVSFGTRRSVYHVLTSTTSSSTTRKTLKHLVWLPEGNLWVF